MTIDEIIKDLEEKVEKSIPVGPQYFLEQAQKLVVLSGNETDWLVALQNNVAKDRLIHIEQGKSVAEAKLRTEATQIYMDMNKQKAKIDRINEIIRISKIQARLKSDELRSGGL